MEHVQVERWCYIPKHSFVYPQTYPNGGTYTSVNTPVPGVSWDIIHQIPDQNKETMVPYKYIYSEIGTRKHLNGLLPDLWEKQMSRSVYTQRYQINIQIKILQIVFTLMSQHILIFWISLSLLCFMFFFPKETNLKKKQSHGTNKHVICIQPPFVDSSSHEVHHWIQS